MADWYVKSTGTDDLSSGRGQSAGNPFASPDYAIAQASPGDRIYIIDTIHALVNVTKNNLTFLDGGAGVIDGQFTLPTTSGGSTLVNPYDGTPSYYSPLVSITANGCVWDGIDIIRSQGRCMVIAGSANAYRTGVVIKNCTMDYANNGVISAQYTDGIIFQNVKAYHGDWYYRAARTAIPGQTNWAVAFNVIYSKNALIKNCVSAYHWGEGMAFGRNTIDSIVEDSVIHNNYSVGFYIHRCQRVIVRRCLLFHTHSVTTSSRGIVIQNEDNFPGALEARDNTVEDCISIGHTRNFQIAGNENSGASITNIKLLNCTGINARGPNGVSDAKGCLSIIANNHFNITIQGCIFYQDAGDIATVSGSLAAYTLGYNAWLGPGNVPAALRKATDISASLFNPNATLPLGTDTLTIANYELSAQAIVGLLTGADTYDYYRNTRPLGSIGAIEYDGAATPDNVAITSASSTNFVESSAGTFTVTTAGTGSPVVLQASGSLPSGVTFVDNGDGTATLAGTPAAATAGNYPIVITASIAAVEYDSQNFLLSVTASTPTPSGSGAMAIARVRVNTTTGLQAIPISGLANPPTAALFVLSPANSNFSPLTTQVKADHEVISYGAATASSEWAISTRSENALATTNTARYSNTGRCIYLRSGSGSGALACDATLDSFAQDTVTINWQTAPPSDYWLTVYAFDATAAYAGVHAVNATLNQKTTVTCSLTPKLGFVAMHARSIPNTAGNSDNIITLGVIGNDGSLVQKAYARRSDDNEPTNKMAGRLLSDRVGAVLFTASGNVNYSLEASNVVASTSIDIYTRDGTPSNAADFGILLLDLADGVYVGTQALPSATGETTHSGIGFPPSAVGIISTTLDAIDAGQTDAGASSYGISGATADVSAATAWYDQSGADPTVTKSAADALALLLIGTDIAASLSGFTSDGVTLNYTLVDNGPYNAIMWATEGVGTIPLYLAAVEESHDSAEAVITPEIHMTATEESHTLDFAAISITVQNALDLAAVEESYADAEAAFALATIPPQRRHPALDDSLRLSVNVYQPLAQGSGQIDEISTSLLNYEHLTTRIGGYWSANMELMGRQENLEDWYENGIGRRIITISPYGNVVWEGFVNQISMPFGNVTVTVGPLLNVINRATLQFTYVDPTSGTALLNLPVETGYVIDAVSQRRWGVMSKVLSTGAATPDTALALVTEYVRKMANPVQSQDFSGSTGSSSIRLDCLGYVHYLDTYPYQNPTASYTTISAKIIAALNAEPNNFIRHDFGRIESNALVEPSFEATNNTALSIIKSLVAKGGSDDIERIFGVYEDRIPVYESAQQEITYYQYVTDPRRRILSAGGSVIEPWDIRPGRWMLSPDLLVGRLPSSDLYNDPRVQFIESVRYRMPYEVVTEGAKVTRLDQRLARLGLSGLG